MAEKLIDYRVGYADGTWDRFHAPNVTLALYAAKALVKRELAQTEGVSIEAFLHAREIVSIRKVTTVSLNGQLHDEFAS